MGELKSSPTHFSILHFQATAGREDFRKDFCALEAVEHKQG